MGFWGAAPEPLPGHKHHDEPVLSGAVQAIAAAAGERRRPIVIKAFCRAAAWRAASILATGSETIQGAIIITTLTNGYACD